ncbi:MAG: carboxypeptidase regulatory-like domain-containing protein [Armatimonadota bacterium]|nr:carboxypeptidase regulatory-like domain-containing protein [bacterium]
MKKIVKRFITCVVLMILSVASSYAANLITDASFESFTVGTTKTSDWQYNDWAFSATAASGGSMEVVSGGQDGSVAIKLSRTSTSGDTAFGVWNTVPGHAHLTPVTAGKRYIVNVWAKSDDAVTMKFQVASFNEDYSSNSSGWISDTTVASVATQTKWALYQMTYTAPTGVTHAAVSCRNMSVGSLYIDNMSMQEVGMIVGNMFPDPSFDSFTAGNTYNTGVTIGSFKFAASTTSLGSMSVITPGEDGDIALKLARAVSGDDLALALCPSNPDARIPVIPGRTYNLSYWLRSSDDAEYFRFTAAGYSSSGAFTGDKSWAYELPNPATGVWTQYSHTYTPVNTNNTTTIPTYISIGMRTRRIGSIDIDNVTVTDVTPSTLAGTVTNSLTSDVVSGATVTLTLDATTYSGTTDSTGAYTITGVTPGTYNIVIAADGYKSYSGSVLVIGTVAQDAAITPVTSVTMADLKSTADETYVAVSEAVVATVASGVFSDGSYYVEAEDRASGIKVLNGSAVSVGSIVTGLTGTLKTDANGERYIDVASMTVGDIEEIGALAMNNKAVGGKDITSGSGAGNVGLLVRVWGTITDRTQTGYILIDDGADSDIKVSLANVSKTLDSGTTFVTVTGICSVEKDSGTNALTPIIIPRGDSDVSW